MCGRLHDTSLRAPPVFARWVAQLRGPPNSMPDALALTRVQEVCTFLSGLFLDERGARSARLTCDCNCSEPAL